MSDPRAKRSGPHETADITQLVDECAASLSLSEPFLCNKDSFNLHDSMAALQLTDKKMDCCEVQASTYAPSTMEKTVFPRPPPSGLADPFLKLPWDELTAKDAAYIGVLSIVRYHAFLSGCSVGESSATCLYAHQAVIHDMRETLLPDDSWKALLSGQAKVEQLEGSTPNFFPKFIVYCISLALLQITEDSRSIVVNADIYEEEDFTLTSFDSSFFQPNEPETLLPIMTSALSLAAKKREKEGDDYRIILLVLQVYNAFLSLAVTMEKTQTDLSGVQRLVRSTAQRFGQLDSLVKPLDDGDNDAFRRLASQAFDPLVNRPLVGNAPVRRPKFSTPSGAIKQLQTIMLELDWALCDLMARGNTLAKVTRVLDRVQQSNLSIYTRSLILTNLFFDEKLLGQFDLRDVVKEYMRLWSHIPDEFFELDDPNLFLGRLGKPMYDVLKLKLLNRCRQRAYIEAVSIPDWLALQSDAHMVDIVYRRSKGMEPNEPPYFSQFILTILLRLMDRHLSSGVELGLFCGFQDIASLFWYRDYILSALLNNLLAMRRTKTQRWLQQQHEATQQQTVPPKSTVKGNGKKKNKGKQKGTAIQPKASPDDGETDCEVIFVTLQRDICRATKRLLALLQQVGVLRPMDYEFTSPKRVFEERYEVFQSIKQPPPLEYSDFVAGSDFSKVSAVDLLRTTADCFETCKHTADQLLVDLTNMGSPCPPVQESELRWLQKVCVGNSIYILKLQSIIRANAQSSTKVAFDFDGPSQFCIVKLQT